MAVVKTVVTPRGLTIRYHDDYLPKTEEELRARQKHMYEVCGQILLNAALRKQAEQEQKQQN